MNQKINNFYIRKAQAYAIIDKLVEVETSVHTIKLLIARRYGFGDKIVENYLDLLEANGVIMMTDGKISNLSREQVKSDDKQE